MKIVICVKQVPEVTKVNINPETGTLIREGIASILNPFCEYALDHAARIKSNRDKVEIVAVSMGPPQARAALLRCLELGADRAVLVSDRKFAGADTWATSLTLASAIQSMVPDFDLILTGKQAIDGDTAQVGPELAEILKIPNIGYAVEVQTTAKGNRVEVKRECETGYEIVQAKTPLLVTVTKGETLRRIPSFFDILAARKKPLQTISAGDLDLDETQLGLQGSFTQVIKVFPPVKKQAGQRVEGVEAAEAARRILAFLREEESL